jgi:hypothetical protein
MIAVARPRPDKNPAIPRDPRTNPAIPNDPPDDPAIPRPDPIPVREPDAPRPGTPERPSGPERRSPGLPPTPIMRLVTSSTLRILADDDDPRDAA